MPLDADPTGSKKFGFTLRVPCGVVAAIAPFNFPLNLVCHKVGPALAAGNTVIVKPASDTPLSAIKLTEILLESGLPPEGIQCITGSGGEIGDALVADRRVRKVTFTGSREIGERICRTAGIKKVTMELGSNSPVIIMSDADLEKVANVVSMTGYGNAGQTCISTQRVLAAKKVYGDFLGAVETQSRSVDARAINSTRNRKSDRWSKRAKPCGSMSGSTKPSARGRAWLPVAAGAARFIYRRLSPTCIPDMRISRDELFGPAVAVTPFDTIEEAIALANDSIYGLAAGIFTENVEWAMKFAREAEAGNLHVNWGSQWRVDLMPYGGLKDSGFGKEGPKYAVQEMTELKMVVFHLNS